MVKKTMSIYGNKTLKEVSKVLDSHIEQRKNMQKQLEEDRNTLLANISSDLVDILIPLLEKMVSVGKVNKKEILDSLKHIKINSQVNVPDIKMPAFPVLEMPKIELPEIKIPKIEMPKIEIPEIKMPKIEVPKVVMPEKMKVEGEVSLKDVSLDNPFPVQIRDHEGKPINFSDNVTNIIGGGGGGGNSKAALLQISSNQNPLAGYVLQVIDDYTTTSVTYFCKMKPDGAWLTMKIDETGNYPTFTYANVSNNAGLTYATAFTNRVTLTYGLLNTLTL